MEIQSLILGQLPFSLLDKSQFNRLLYFSKVESFRKGKYIYYQGDPVKNIYFIIDGRVNLYMWDNKDRENLMKEEIKGNWLGISECSMNELYQFDARALTDIKTLTINKVSFNELLNIPELNYSIIHSLSKWNHFLRSKLTKGSCLEELEEYINSSSSRKIDITQDMLAVKLGFTRESINKNLKKLESDGFIELGRGYVIKKDSL